MRSPAAHILETALALQRAPGERFRLRARPLPPGVIHLIEVAAGSPLALQAAAAEVGESEPVLLEAARFYLEQVLFADPDADAYRVLGIAADVPHDTIRTHHRWLQRWLHPDRAQAGDATVFATRVNQAFAQLRSPEVRHAYDVRLAEARMAGASAPLPAATLRRWELGDDGAHSGSTGRRSRWLLAAAALSCAVLAVLIVRNPQNATAWQDDGHPQQARADAVEPVDAPAIEDRDLGILSDALALTPAAPEPMGPPPSVAVDLPPADLPAAEPANAAPGLVAAVAAPAQAAMPTAADRQPAPRRRQAAVASAQVPASASAPARAPASAGAATLVAVASRDAPAAAAAPVTAAQPAVPPPPGPDPAVQRRAAEQRADEVVGYLGATPGIIPLWNDPDVEAQASRLRGALNARSGSLRLTQTAWVVGAESASLAAAYRCRSASTGDCEGRLTVDLVRRGGFWFVRRVALAPPA